MQIPKTPKFIQSLFADAVWSIPNSRNEIYLTFDDGPHLQATEFVLNELQKFHAKATFFWVGSNIQQHPEFISKLEQAGHSLGNHTFSHVNGFKTNTADYLANVEQGFEISKSKLFRPPYGKLRPLQYQKLSKKYKIIMWDVLGEDYNQEMKAEDCIEKIIRQTESGSIIVLHDSEKCFEKLKLILPAILEYFSNKGYQFMPVHLN